jgi:hypothetical protein
LTNLKSSAKPLPCRSIKCSGKKKWFDYIPV